MGKGKKRRLCVVGLLAVWLTSTWAHGLEPQPDALFVRVVDVGAGLCTVAVAPGGHYLIYDAGDYRDKGALTFCKIQELIPPGADVDLLVLSHTDSDHIGAVDQICRDYRVEKIVHPGYPSKTGTWLRAKQAIRLEQKDGCKVVNLRDTALLVGKREKLGDASLVWVFGLSQAPPAWVKQYSLDESERKNVGSISLRLDYQGHSILLCGDTVGRHIGDKPEVCMAAEKAMVGNAAAVPLHSEVLVAPHHGGDNGSSVDFIHAVEPTYVIFSAGHVVRFHHPRASTAERYVAAGVLTENMFRTDMSDDEGNEEWDYGRISGCRDEPGDDDVDICIRTSGDLQVEYRNEHH